VIFAMLLIAFLAGVVVSPLYMAAYSRQQQGQHRPEPSGAGGEHG
jgi:hypothetical protein